MQSGLSDAGNTESMLTISEQCFDWQIADKSDRSLNMLAENIYPQQGSCCFISRQ